MTLAGDEKNASDRFDGSTFAANDTTHVVTGNANFDSHVLTIRILSYFDLVGLADQGRDYSFDSFFHKDLGSLAIQESPGSRIRMNPF